MWSKRTHEITPSTASETALYSLRYGTTTTTEKITETTQEKGGTTSEPTLSTNLFYNIQYEIVFCVSTNTLTTEESEVSTEGEQSTADNQTTGLVTSIESIAYPLSSTTISTKESTVSTEGLTISTATSRQLPISTDASSIEQTAGSSQISEITTSSTTTRLTTSATEASSALLSTQGQEIAI
ncbi:hypothetical protein COOONC_13340, partial [Cooperia oncophora]